ncbi:MAG: hypothetical protein ACI9MR_004416 [Myxococcota bacterium]|jgi:hypothetical protein
MKRQALLVAAIIVGLAACGNAGPDRISAEQLAGATQALDATPAKDQPEVVMRFFGEYRSKGTAVPLYAAPVPKALGEMPRVPRSERLGLSRPFLPILVEAGCDVEGWFGADDPEARNVEFLKTCPKAGLPYIDPQAGHKADASYLLIAVILEHQARALKFADMPLHIRVRDIFIDAARTSGPREPGDRD